MAILNDKQSVNFPMDYPKFDQNAKITNVNICKGITSQLGYYCIFKDHFSNLKKFAAQLMKLGNLNEVILKNEISLDQYFSDNSSSLNFTQKISMMYSPMRATPLMAF